VRFAMKVAFKSKTYSFYAEFNDTLAAKEIIKHLPLELNVEKVKNKIYFYLGLELPRDVPSSEIKIGDVIFLPQDRILCVYLELGDLNEAEKYGLIKSGIVVGRVLAPLNELKSIQLEEKINVSYVEEKKQYDDRILSQEEIDELVKELLAKKHSSNI
jgi:hypothetical protein